MAPSVVIRFPLGFCSPIATYHTHSECTTKNGDARYSSGVPSIKDVSDNNIRLIGLSRGKITWN